MASSAQPKPEHQDAEDVAGLVRGAANGEAWAWEELVARYGRMVGSVGRRFGLSSADSAEAAQATWMKLVEHIHRLRQPERVGGWLATTAQRECLRILRGAERTVPALAEVFDDCPDERTPEPDAQTIAEERAQAVRSACTHLSERDRRMIYLLFGEPEMSYKELSETLGMPTGSIGPTRGRCLDHLYKILADVDGIVA